MKINLPIDYIFGYIRRGHLEGEIDMSFEEENDFKTLLTNEMYNTLSKEEKERLENYKELIIDDCDIVIDNYDLEDWKGINWNKIL